MRIPKQYLMDLLVAGFDEVGRGCLAGPVIAAAVILDPKKPISGLADSKKLTPKQRERLAILIKSNAIAWALGRAEASEVDEINVLQASLLAMSRAFPMLQVKPGWARVDGNCFPDVDCPGESIIQGDSKFSEISAASILAKVARDDEMVTLDVIYKGYHFAKHKGYPTQLHLQKLQQIGISPQHRKSFAPVRKYC